MNYSFRDNFLPEDLYKSTLSIMQDKGFLNSEEDYLNFNGRRSSFKNRYYITKQSTSKEQEIAKFFNENFTIINSYLKLEFANDRPGFFLNKHTDHPEKKQVIIVYIEGPEDTGTSFQIKDDVTKLDFIPNRAIIFKPDTTSTYDPKGDFHWVETINDTRRTLIINWVDKDTWKETENCYA
jgi:hypothetical protein